MRRLLPRAEKVRQGGMLLRTRAQQRIFLAGLAAPVVLLLVLWLASS